MVNEDKKNFLINFFYTIVIGALIFLVCKFLINYLLPFIIAAVIAFLMQKPSHFLSSKIRVKTGIVAMFLSAAVYIAVATLAVFLIYKLTVSLGGIAQNLPDFLTQITDKINALRERFADVLPGEYTSLLDDLLNGMFEKISASVTSFVSNTLTNIAKNAPSFLFSSIVALVASCYIAKDYEGLLKFVKELCGKRITANIIKIKTILFESVFKLLKGYLILMAITYLELTAGFLILKVKYAFLIALLISVVDVLPVLGTGTVMIPWVVISALLGNIRLAIGLAVIYIIITVVRNFLEPKIIGTQMGINPLFTLLAMFIGLKIFGVFGLLAFPVILIVVIKYYKNEMQEGLSLS